MITIPQMFLVVLLSLPYLILNRKGRTPTTTRQIAISRFAATAAMALATFSAALDAYLMIAHVETRNVLVSRYSTSSLPISPDTNPFGYVLLFSAYFFATFFFAYLAYKAWRGQKI